MKDLDKFKVLFQKDTNIRSKQATHNGKGLFKQNSFRNTETYMKEMRALGRVSVQSTKEVKRDSKRILVGDFFTRLSRIFGFKIKKTLVTEKNEIPAFSTDILRSDYY